MHIQLRLVLRLCRYLSTLAFNDALVFTLCERRKLLDDAEIFVLKYILHKEYSGVRRVSLKGVCSLTQTRSVEKKMENSLEPAEKYHMHKFDPHHGLYALALAGKNEPGQKSQPPTRLGIR